MYPSIVFGLGGVLILGSAIVHELGHGWVARWMGDSTAQSRGRLTLSPRAHFDVLGWMVVPVAAWFWFQIPIAYARPAPVDTRRLEPLGLLLVGLSGPLTNGIMAVLLSLAFRGVFEASMWGWFPYAASPPILDGLKLGIVMNIVLGIGNLLPVPPLDGSRILIAVLPSGWSQVWHRSYPLWIGLFLAGSVVYAEPMRRTVEDLVGPVFRLLTGASFLV